MLLFAHWHGHSPIHPSTGISAQLGADLEAEPVIRRTEANSMKVGVCLECLVGVVPGRLLRYECAKPRKFGSPKTITAVFN